MNKKIIKFEFIFLSFFAGLNLIYFAYQDKLPDNYYEIHSASANTIFYYPVSLLAHVGYYTGIWTFLSLVLFISAKFFFEKKQNIKFLFLMTLAPITLGLIVTYLFLPFYIGSGLLTLLENSSHIVVWYLLFLSHILGIIFLLNPNSFKKISKNIAHFKFDSRLAKNFRSDVVRLFSDLNLEALRSKIQLFYRTQDNAHKEVKASKLATPSSYSSSNVEAQFVATEEEMPRDQESPEDADKVKMELDDTLDLDSSSDTDENSDVDEESSTKEHKSTTQPFFESKDLIECIVAKKSSNVKNFSQEEQYFDDISQTIEEKLKEFGIQADVINLLKGPVVNTFELNLGAGVAVSKVINKTDDLSLALYGAAIRMVYPMKGKNTIGIEVPRSPREVIYLDEVLNSEAFLNSQHRLPIAMGKDAYGEATIMDLATMPHMLVAGSTGAGKSVFINTLLVSLIIKLSPENLKLILIDPKQLELAHYQTLPHLILPVVTDHQTASVALLWAVEEMERRYSMMKEIGVKNIEGFNNRIKDLSREQLSKIAKYRNDDETGEMKLPYLVVIVDEFADLVLSKSGKEIETNISRLAAKARASGIHIVLATQRPSIDVITGVIKANFPTRVSFRVTTNADSRVVLDTMGAERLLGKGDMLFKLGVDLIRLHSAFVDENEIEKLVNKMSSYQSHHSQAALEFIEKNLVSEGTSGHFSHEDSSGEKDEFFDQAVSIVAEERVASASMLQRRLKIGYNRAANLIEEMERKGIIGPQQGSKPRVVLISSPDSTDNF